VFQHFEHETGITPAAEPGVGRDAVFSLRLRNQLVQARRRIPCTEVTQITHCVRIFLYARRRLAHRKIEKKSAARAWLILQYTAIAKTPDGALRYILLK